jgi:[acyl-carrier-protein] S-malonyltransferase
MGRELAAELDDARRVFEEADDVLGFGLSRIMWDGPAEELTETRNAQPAILTHSVAVHTVLRDRLGEVALAAGHSLGEFSAHVAARTLSFRDALLAVRLRGELMFAAGEERPGTMAAVLGLDDETVRGVCESVEGAICVPANFNSPGQVVISGDIEGVHRGMELADEAGARRVVELNVSGAFHSPLMEPAERGLREALASVAFEDPDFPVVSNVTAAPVTSGEDARELLVRQLTSPVRWAASVAAMVNAGVDRFLELGPGRVLCGLNRRNAKGLACTSIEAPEELQALES